MSIISISQIRKWDTKKALSQVDVALGGALVSGLSSGGMSQVSLSWAPQALP
jgi:hypothetical protein